MSAVMEASLLLMKLLILIGLLGIGSAEDLENQFCPAECRDCDELGNCLTCKDYKYLQLYDCVEKCSPGFYPDADQCLECPWSCESCSSPNECHSCRTDYYFQNGACIDMCSTGFYLDGTDCFECQIGCIECWEADECVECETGFYLQENQCVTECSYGYAKVDEGNLCLPCRTGCEICSGPTQQCEKCKSGLYMKGNTCITKAECDAGGESSPDGICKVKHVKIPRNQLLRLSTLIHLPKKDSKYKIKFTQPGRGRLFIATPMDGWPTYVLPDWKQPMALDGEELLDDIITEINGDDLDNAWYRPSSLDTSDSSADVLNYQVFDEDTMMDESQFELEVIDNSIDQIRPNPTISLDQIVPPGTTRTIHNLEFISRDGVRPEDIIYIIISRLPTGFATVERDPYGPSLEFTQADINAGHVKIKTMKNWPGHDLTFEFLVQDPQGTTIDPYTFTIKSPKLHLQRNEDIDIDLMDLGIEEDVLYDETAFLLLQKSPHYGHILADGEKLSEEESCGTDAILTYAQGDDNDLSEDFFVVSLYWNGIQEDIQVMVEIEQGSQLEQMGSMVMDVHQRREVLMTSSLSYKSSINDDIEYKITEDPLWGILEMKINGKYSPLAWGSTFSQQDIEEGKLFYHYYGNDQEVDSLGLNIKDGITSLEEKLEIQIAISSEYGEAGFDSVSSEDESDHSDSYMAGMDDYGFGYDDEFARIDQSSTLGSVPLLTVPRNSKHILTPENLGLTPAGNDWLEIEQSPVLGQIKMADNGQEMTSQQVASLMDGMIIYQAGPITGRDVVKFKIYLVAEPDSEQILTVQIDVVDNVPEIKKISGREHRPQNNIHETQLMPTVQTDLLADDQNRKGTFPEDYPKMPSVKNTIEVQSNKIKVITELATLPGTDEMTKFTITSPPSKGNLKLLVEPGSKIGKVLQSGDEFTRQDVSEGRLCYIGINGVGRNAVTVREDSFGYTIGTGPNKRFGQISIRVEDFLLARTGDPSVPGSEIPIEPNQESGAFVPDPQVIQTGDRTSESSYGPSPDFVRYSQASPFQPLSGVYSHFKSIVVNVVPVMTLAKVYCEEGGRKMLTSNEISATDSLNSRASTLEFTIQRECRHGNVELFMNGDWVKVDTFTMQDILSNEVSYVHDGSETKSDRCIIFVSNDQGEQSDEEPLEISVHSIDDGAPHVTINLGLVYLEEIDGAPTGPITANVLTTVDPDTDDSNIMYTIYDGPTHGAVFNSATGSAITQFTQADINNKRIEYVLRDVSMKYDRDQFRFTVRDSQQVIEGNMFNIKWSMIEFEKSQMTVAESETEVHVMIKRTGYLNHYAIVTCRSLSGDQQQQQVQFEPGESQKPCVVPLNSDDAFQGEREVNLELAEPTYAILGDTKSMLLIVNDPEDMPTISFLSDEIHINEEEKSLIIPIRREGDASVTATVICYTVSGSASSSDFESRDRLENNQLVFMGTPFNERDSTCRVNLIDDSLFEEDEFFFVKLEKASYNARLGKIDTVKVIIDGPNDFPIIEMSETILHVEENSGVVEVEITRSGSDLSQRSEVFCYSRASTAETGFDFEQVQQEVIFEPNEDRAICQVTLIDDYENQVVEGDEEFHVYLSGAVGATLGAKKETKIMISDVEEDSPKFEFSEAEVRAAESVGVVSVPVKRLGDASEEASVICRTLQGSAHIEEDFMERTNTEMYRISFGPGETEKPCEVIMMDDGNHELDETFFLQLKDPRSSSIYPAVLGNHQEVKITITNEEDVPTITFSKNEVSVREPEPAKTRDVTVHVKRMGDTNGNSRVRVSTRDGSAISGVDYEPKSEMLRFLPNSNDVVFTVTVKCNEKSAWHKTFSLVMGPDEPINAVLGQFSSMTVTILDKEAAGSLVLPSPPSVISLEDLNKMKIAAKEPKTGYPIVCVTPCDKEYPGYSDMESLCNEAGINNEHVRYSWEIALPDSSNFERLSDITPWTNPKSKVLDSVYFKPKCRVRCVAQAYSPEGKGGTPLRSVPVTISAEGYCHNPLVGGSRAFQAQNFHTELEYLDNEDKDHPNSVRIKVEVPHEDGLLPIISTSKIYNIDFLLRNEVFRQQHVCSNLLTPSQAPQTQAGRGFMDGYDAARIPQIPGFDLPHQFDDELRSPQSLSLYQYLNLKSCTWTFETFYTMTELAQTCGGEISKDFEYAKRGQSHVTVKVPFYVSYIYVQAPTGWASLQHQSQLEISFSYSNVMWRTGIQTDSEFTGEVVIERVSIDTYGRLVVEFKSTAHFRGLFVDKHHSVADTKASFEPPLNVQTNFTLELVWSEETYDSPVQHWKATSKFSRKDYTGEYDLNLIPCSVQPTQGYESPAEVPPEEGALMPGQPANRKPDKIEKKDPPCSAQEPKTFKIKIAFQQSNRPVPVVYSLNTFFHITNSKQIFLTEPKEQNIEEIDYKGTFAKGSRIYARVLWEPKQDLKDAYKLQLEKVYLCTGSNGFVPTFDPSGDIYGQGPQYGCIRPMKSISHRFLILDRGNRDAEDEDFQDIKFEAEFASDNPEYYTLHKISSCDGFSFNVDPLYKIVAGHEWYLQVLYVIGSADGRMRRHAEMVTVSDYVERKRRAVAGGDEYLQTLFSSHSAQNGTNMHGLQLVQPEEGIVGIIIGTVSTCLIMILVIFFVYRRRQDSKSADDEDRLTAEEEALIAKKLGSMSHSQYGQSGHVPKVNNIPSVYTESSNKKLNNQTNYHQPANRRNDIMIRNHITPPNVKIHNNLRSKRDGTEI